MLNSKQNIKTIKTAICQYQKVIANNFFERTLILKGRVIEYLTEVFRFSPQFHHTKRLIKRQIPARTGSQVLCVCVCNTK